MVRAGTLEVDGKVVVRTPTDWINQNRAASAAAKTARADDDVANKHVEHVAFDAGVELNVSKAAIDPVWNLPEVARRFGERLIQLARQVKPLDFADLGCACRCCRGHFAVSFAPFLSHLRSMPSHVRIEHRLTTSRRNAAVTCSRRPEVRCRSCSRATTSRPSSLPSAA